jgi:hypothetical protein
MWFAKYIDLSEKQECIVSRYFHENISNITLKRNFSVLSKTCIRIKYDELLN